MKNTFIIAIIAAFTFGFYTAEAKELVVNKKKENLVKFVSDAPVEDFEGVTDKIDGYAKWEDINSLTGGKVYFEVDLRKVDTGIGLRNRHMRENYLHTDKYPYAVFEGSISKAELKEPNKAYVTVKGQMDIHGKKKEMTINGWITTNGSGSYRIQSNFDVNLTDHNIEVPELMMVKIDENMELTLDFYLLETGK